MDGSIADSTMLRLRSGLGRVYQPAANSTANDFFEELLRLPVASSIETPDDQGSTSPDPLANLTTDPQSQVSDNDTTSEDQADKDDSETKDAAAPPIVAGCYAPWAYTGVVPEGAAPDSAVETQVVASLATEAPVAKDATGNTQASDVLVELPVKGQPADITAEQEVSPVADQAILPIEPQRPAMSQQKIDPARDVRRPKIRDEKSTGPVDPQQHQLQQTTQAVAKPSTESVAPVSPASEVSAAEQQAVNVVVQDAGEPKSQSGNDERRVPEREKWYAGDRSDAQSKVSELLADQQLDDGQSDGSSLNDRRDLQELLTNSESSQVDASNSSSASTDAMNINDIMQSVALTNPSAAIESSIGRMSGDSEATGIAGNAAIGKAGQSSGHPGPDSHTVMQAGRGNGTASPGSRAPGGSASDPASDEVESRQLSQQERVRLVQRVARSFSRLGPDGGQVTLKLHPPQLGVLNVSIKIEGQTMTARMQTETSAARDVILDNLPVLRERLSEQGIEVEKFQVEVATAEDFSSGQQGQTGDSPSGGASGGRNESSRDSIDYRRLRRDDPPPRLERSASPEFRPLGWPDKSLDVKA